MNNESPQTFLEDRENSNSSDEQSDWSWLDLRNIEDIDFDAFETINNSFLPSQENINIGEESHSWIDSTTFLSLSKIIRNNPSCCFKDKEY